MAHRVQVFLRELKDINNFKHDKQICNRIIDEGRKELVHCICDCVYNIFKGNIPIDEEEMGRMKPYRHCLRKPVNEKTSYSRKKKLIQDGGFLGPLIPILAGLV